MWDRIVIDACTIIRDKGFFRWMNSYRGTKILPLVAYIEYSVGQRRRGKSQEKIDYLIKKVAHMEIPQFKISEAIQTINIVSNILDNCEGEVNFKNKWRDCMIASHAYLPPTLLITDNVGDFWFLNTRVFTPEQIRERYRDKM